MLTHLVRLSLNSLFLSFFSRSMKTLNSRTSAIFIACGDCFSLYSLFLLPLPLFSRSVKMLNSSTSAVFIACGDCLSLYSLFLLPFPLLSRSVKTLNSSTSAVFIACGDSKAEVVAQILEETSGTGSKALPASLINPAKGCLSWYGPALYCINSASYSSVHILHFQNLFHF